MENAGDRTARRDLDKAIRYFRGSELITEDFLDRFAACLRAHAERLVAQGGDARLQSNWCVLENSGLLEIALALPQNEQTEEWIRIALDRLERSSRVQVYADGSQWEQSPMYHNEVITASAAAFILPGSTGFRFRKEWKNGCTAWQEPI